MSVFSSIRVPRVRKSVFDLSHDVKMSMRMGDLVPFFCQDVLPGDKFHVSSEVMIRLAPMLAPVMHRVNVFTHFFFVPNRLVYSNWENFITGGENGEFAGLPPRADLAIPAVRDKFVKKSLADYLGYAVGDNTRTPAQIYSPSDFVSTMPFRAYQLIYNEYYRDQNLITEVPINFAGNVDGSASSLGIFDMRKRAWEKDYFTSALPWTQRGGEVSLPMSGNADIVIKDENMMDRYKMQGLNVPSGTAHFEGSGMDPNLGEQLLDTNHNQGTQIQTNNWEADMSSVNSTTINELRRAARLQEWLEKNARSGARYVEQILAHFGVKSKDSRLQRPEFLGGGKQPVVISEVLQTSSTDATSPQANMSGHGISVGSSNRFRRYFDEHGYIIGIVSVLPKTSYQQGLQRQYQRQDRFDYYFPEFADLGEQEVRRSEVMMTPGANGVGNTSFPTFGYQQRYCEYKYIPSRVAGDFRDELSYWHLGRIFDPANIVSLNRDFVESTPRKDIFAVTTADEDELYMHIYNNTKAVRPMPKHSIPRL